MKDMIEDVLETVNFKSAVYFKHGFCGNWGMDSAASTFAQFHFVASGHCVLEIGTDTYELSRGDLAVFPNGLPHRIKANDTSPCIPGYEAVTKIVNGSSPFEEGKLSTQLICGHFELDRELSHFVLQDLPEWMIIKDDDYGRFDVMNTVLELIIEELETKKAGYRLVSLRFAEILFIAILRHFYLHIQEGEAGNLLKDEAIYRSVNYIHQHIDEALSIDQLSRLTGISRTLFIERFKKAVGKTPLVYIKSWRMIKSKQLLKSSDCTLSEISDQVGYASASAFNRVFKQTFGTSPKKFRRAERTT